MGMALMNQVDAAMDVKGSTKHILSTLARWAHKQTGLVWLKQETQAAIVGRTEETIRTATKRLEELSHISRLCTKAKVTLYLVHPCNTLVNRPQLEWSIYEEHLKRSYFPKSEWPRIANWLAALGVLSGDDAIKVSSAHHTFKPKKRAQRTRPPLAEIQNSWALAAKNLGLDPKIKHTEPPEIGADYKGREIKNNLDEKGAVAVEMSDTSQSNERVKVSETHEHRRDFEKAANGSTIERIKEGMTADQLTVQMQRVTQILEGRKRPDRFTMTEDQPDDNSTPE